MIFHWFRGSLAGWGELVWTRMFCCPLNWSCFAVQGLKTGIVQLQRCVCSHGHILPWVVLMAEGTTTVPTSTLVDIALSVGCECTLCCPRLFSLWKCLLAYHTVSYRQKARVSKLSVELSEVCTHTSILLPAAEDLLLTVLVLFGGHIRFYWLEAKFCVDS